MANTPRQLASCITPCGGATLPHNPQMHPHRRRLQPLPPSLTRSAAGSTHGRERRRRMLGHGKEPSPRAFRHVSSRFDSSMRTNTCLTLEREGRALPLSDPPPLPRRRRRARSVAAPLVCRERHVSQSSTAKLCFPHLHGSSPPARTTDEDGLLVHPNWRAQRQNRKLEKFVNS